MRTTLDIDDAILSAARSLARARGISLGAAVSELARRGLGIESSSDARVDFSSAPFPVLVGDPDHVVTPDLILEHRDGD